MQSPPAGKQQPSGLNEGNRRHHLNIYHHPETTVDLDEPRRLLGGKDLGKDRDVLEPQLDFGIIRLEPSLGEALGQGVGQGVVVPGIFLDQGHPGVVVLARFRRVFIIHWPKLQRLGLC